MQWQAPDFVEIKMDAEVSAYQGDDGPGPTPPWTDGVKEPADQGHRSPPAR